MPSPPIQDVLAAHRDALMAIPEVVGAAIGRYGATLCIRVFVVAASEAVHHAIPDTLDGYPVHLEVSGGFPAR